MPVHDWSRVDAGVFHDFHNVWIGEMRNALNGGVLPSGYYAMSEQHAGRYIADVLTLHGTPADEPPPPPAGGVAVAERPPRVRREVSLEATARTRRRTLTIRHVSGHRVIALLEIVSPANKDRPEHVTALVNKLEDALRRGIHLLVVDLFAAGTHDLGGIHAALWDRLGSEAEDPPAGEPLTLAAYAAGDPVRAYLEYVAVGRPLPAMPLFLSPDHYIDVPLEATYDTTWRGTPEVWRRVLEAEGD